MLGGVDHVLLHRRVLLHGTDHPQRPGDDHGQGGHDPHRAVERASRGVEGQHQGRQEHEPGDRVQAPADHGLGAHGDGLGERAHGREEQRGAQEGVGQDVGELRPAGHVHVAGGPERPEDVAEQVGTHGADEEPVGGQPEGVGEGDAEDEEHGRHAEGEVETRHEGVERRGVGVRQRRLDQGDPEDQEGRGRHQEAVPQHGVAVVALPHPEDAHEGEHLEHVADQEERVGEQSLPHHAGHHVAEDPEGQHPHEGVPGRDVGRAVAPDGDQADRDDEESDQRVEDLGGRSGQHQLPEDGQHPERQVPMPPRGAQRTGLTRVGHAANRFHRLVLVGTESG